MKPYTEEEFAQKFWEKVDKTSDPQGCWLWTGRIHKLGAGHVRWKGKVHYTHRVAYLISGKTIPENLVLAHSEYCVGKRHCCNPDHLTPKTQTDNNRDKYRDNTMPYKITPEQVSEIRAIVESTHTEIANKFKVSRRLIGQILNFEKRFKSLDIV